MINDELKIASDDAVFTTDHIMFLISKYRAFLLKQRYADVKKQMPNSNYQTLCLTLSPDNNIGICSNKEYLRSNQKVPFSMGVSLPKVSPMDFFGGEINYVTWSRFRYVGNNKFLKNAIYATIGPDNYLYVTSANPNAMYLCNAMVTAVFEDFNEASALSCNQDGSTIACDEYERNFPLEEALIPQLIQLVVQELTGSVYRPRDEQNNSSDDLSGIPTK